MKLFAFYVGGETETSNTELHDMRFAVAERMEDCHRFLRISHSSCSLCRHSASRFRYRMLHSIGR
jgi:hypothetical protein